MNRLKRNFMVAIVLIFSFGLFSNFNITKVKGNEEVKEEIYIGLNMKSFSMLVEGKSNYLISDVNYYTNAAIVGLPKETAVLFYAGSNINSPNFAIPDYMESFERYNKEYHGARFENFEEFKIWISETSSIKVETWEEYVKFYQQTQRELYSLECEGLSANGYVSALKTGEGFNAGKVGTISGDTFLVYKDKSYDASHLKGQFIYEFEKAQFSATDVSVKIKNINDITEDKMLITPNMIGVNVNIDGKLWSVEHFEILDSNNTINVASGDKTITVKIGKITKEIDIVPDGSKISYENMYYNLREITSVKDLVEGKSNYTLLKESYSTKEAIVDLPKGGAMLFCAGTTMKSPGFGRLDYMESFERYNKEKLDSKYKDFDEFRLWAEDRYNSTYPTWEDYVEQRREYIIESIVLNTMEYDGDAYFSKEGYDTDSDYKAGEDTKLKYVDSGNEPGWYYAYDNWDSGSLQVSYEGPLHLYEYTKSKISSEDINVKLKNTGSAPDGKVNITNDDIIVEIKNGEQRVELPFYKILAYNNNIDVSNGDKTITIKVDDIIKEVDIISKEPGEVYDKEDINKDNKVDILDLSLVSMKYNTNNSVCDFNKDGIVDIYDIIFVARKIETIENKVLEWVVESDYKNGDIVSYNGKTYKCITNHKSQLSWNPEVAWSLWISFEEKK